MEVRAPEATVDSAGHCVSPVLQSHFFLPCAL